MEKNLSHKQNVLFYIPPCNFINLRCDKTNRHFDWAKSSSDFYRGKVPTNITTLFFLNYRLDYKPPEFSFGHRGDMSGIIYLYTLSTSSIYAQTSPVHEALTQTPKKRIEKGSSPVVDFQNH